MPIETSLECDCNYIKETVARIDKLQKEVVTIGETRCVSCDASLFTSANNTIPVTLTSNCGTLFTGLVDVTGTSTAFFRIESIRCGRFVTLRLLVVDGTTVTATSRTMVLDLDDVTAIQCHEPITVEVCQSSLTPNP
ncbi:MAG: hypothetical protein K2H02_03375 [Anaeroplasmataceae bacterium]|nr:hypothetical protein [Anaeroplasmataceae bacterium]